MQKDNVLAINKIAKEREAMGFNVINGSIGMMFFDDGHFPKNKTIRNILSKHTNDDDLAYSSISGEKEYRNLVLEWFFGNEFEDKNVKTIATQGGTGAVFISVMEENLRYKNNILLFPDIGWPNYFGIAESYNIDYIQYPLFDKSLRFNIDGILSLFDKLLKKGKHISFVINDPCHNPTGYSMNEAEWDALVDFVINKTRINNFTLIVDCAYLDFADKKTKECAIKSIKTLSDYVPTFLCLSCSKTFSFYGLRCGELVTVCPDIKLLADIRDKTIKLARGAWSTPNHMAVNAVIDILKSKDGKQELIDEINECKQIIEKRAAIFIKEADSIGLKYYPYCKGFFITLIVDDAYKLAEELMKRDIYLAPIGKNHLRVALCSVSVRDIYNLVTSIKCV